MTTIDGDDVRAAAADWAGAKAVATAAPPRTARRDDEESFMLNISVVIVAVAVAAAAAAAAACMQSTYRVSKDMPKSHE